MPVREVFLIIGDELFEAARFTKSHPGEGINDVYIQHYHRKNVTSEMDRYHFDDEPDEMLIKAREKRYDPDTGIYFLGPSYFKNKVPPFFHFFHDDIKGEKFMSEKGNMTFIVRPIEGTTEQGVAVTYKNSEGTTSHTDFAYSKEASTFSGLGLQNQEMKTKSVEEIAQHFTAAGYQAA